MTVKLALLKSGEDVIADIKELVSEETNRVVSYIFSNPCVVKLSQPQMLTEEYEEEVRKYNISVYPWMPLTEDTDIPVSPDWVVSVVEPAKKLKIIYEENANGRTSNRSTDSDSSLSRSDMSDLQG